MLKKWIVVLFILLSVSVSNAVEVAERISDREIVERLTKLETKLDEGQKATNQRFDDVGKRFDQMFTFLWILTGIFTAMTTATISFAILDRRNMLKPVEMKIKKLEEGKVSQLINSLKDLAKVDKNVADVLKQYNFL